MKITIVGGGSYNWAPTLISDMLQEDAIAGSEVWLLDINLKAAEEVKLAVDYLAKQNGKKMEFIATGNADDAFRNADLILITISTGGFETMTPDLELPEKYGIYQMVGDSVGPGGWSRALRNVPVFVKFAEKISRLAPKAYVLNYSNPMECLTGVFSAVSNLQAIGLCHGPVGTIHYLAKMLEAKPEDISAKFAGVNHFFWITDFSVNGQDGYELIREKMANSDLSVFHKSNGGACENDHEIQNELFMNFGYFTYYDENHISEYIPGYLNGLETIKRFRMRRKVMADRRKDMKKAHQKVLDMAAEKILIPPKSIEIAVDMMKAVATGQEYSDVVNMPNLGQIPNLPEGAVVETQGMISPLGFSAIMADPLPEPLRIMVEPHCRVQKMTLEAALKGDRKLALQALMLDPLCRALPLSDIRKLGLELMEANRDWLPQFK